MISCKNYSDQLAALKLLPGIRNITMHSYPVIMHTSLCKNQTYLSQGSKSSMMLPVKIQLPAVNTIYCCNATAPRVNTPLTNLWHGFLKNALIKTSDL